MNDLIDNKNLKPKAIEDWRREVKHFFVSYSESHAIDNKKYFTLIKYH